MKWQSVSAAIRRLRAPRQDSAVQTIRGWCSVRSMPWPGRRHVADVRRGQPVTGDIRHLRNIGAEGTNDLCGACHRTWETVVLRGLRGLNNARFQPYRLAGSKCFSDDSRIACTSCHDPHSALQSNSKFYDGKCTACHNSSNTPASSSRGERLFSVFPAICLGFRFPGHFAPSPITGFAFFAPTKSFRKIDTRRISGFFPRGCIGDF